MNAVNAMRAWQVGALGEPVEVMRLRDDVPRPIPDEGQVLVRVLAAAVNFPDALMCRGHYQIRPPLPFTPVWSCAARWSAATAVAAAG